MTYRSSHLLLPSRPPPVLRLMTRSRSFPVAPPTISGTTASVRTMGLHLSGFHSGQGLLHRATVELSEHLSMHPALRVQHKAVDKTRHLSRHWRCRFPVVLLDPR